MDNSTRAELAEALKKAESHVFIEFAGRVLAFTAGQVQEAAERGLQLFPAKPGVGISPGDEPLLNAEQAAELTRLPKAWLLDAARQGKAPHYRLGKYVRFRLSELADKGRVPVKQHLELVKWTKG